MALRRLLFLPAVLLWACAQPPDVPATAGDGASCTPPAGADTTGAGGHHGIRGALLGTRFASFDALKSVLQFEYGPEGAYVRVRHCSGGREVESFLEPGAHQGLFTKARHKNAYGAKLNVVFASPYAAAHRKELEYMYTLSRWRPERFGADDPAFFDIAKTMVANINTPDLAFRYVRDSTEKGYLNSFNHITIQAFITSLYSEELADFVADTHERYLHPELITGVFTEAQLRDLDNGPVDNYVDIVNNEWGQELGKQLKIKYNLSAETRWTPQLLADYLNDVQAYFSWAFQIGFRPFTPEDEAVLRFADKIDGMLFKGK